MNIFYAEYIKDYSSYTFSYVPYAVFQSADEMAQIYNAGFLPYTGNIKLNHYLYYKARSVRIDLKSFEMGSENRRVNRKFESYKISAEWIPVDEFDIESEGFISFCTEYSRQRFKGGEMESDRLDYILRSPFLTDVLEFQIEGQTAGYVFISRNEEFAHYWYSFYDLEDFQELPLGKYMMMEVIRQAKEMGLQHCYLGTCYGPHSLYKIRDFKGVEFQDGSQWSTDTKQLKSWCKSDDEVMVTDRFKNMAPDEANDYIHSLLNETNQ